MANLETLFIEIDGSAEKAKGGIDSLVTSLSALGQVIQNQLGPLKEFSATLKGMKANSVGGIGGFGPTVANATATGIKKVTKATTEYAKATKALTLPTNSNGEIVDVYGNPVDKSLPIWADYYKKQVAYFTDAQKEMGAVSNSVGKAIEAPQSKLEALEMKYKGVSDAMQKAAEEGNELATANKKLQMLNIEKQIEAEKNAYNGLAETTKKVSTASRGLFSQVGRIAKTMLIRTAIRSLMKVAKQGLQNYYQYSKSISGAFATAVQSIQLNVATSGNQIGAMLGSLLTSIAPILNTILTIVSAVAEAITMLFSLLGGSVTYPKAVNGFNSIGKAAGGAGGKVKELLADFDELNVIAQESGGGGGGSAGAFGFDFEWPPLPQWMQEWKPLIEALIAGTLGAIILPKIFNWVRRIFGLGTGSGANIIKDILNKLFGKDNNANFSIKGIEDELVKLGLVTAELEAIKKAIEDINKLKMPDFSAAATQMGILAAAAMLGAPYIESIVAAIEGLKGGIGLFDILGTLISALLTGLIGNKKIKIEIDREEFDKFKEEIDEWDKGNMDKSVRIGFDPAYYNNFVTVVTVIDEWAKKPYEKSVRIGFQSAYYNNFVTVVTVLDEWAKKSYAKEVLINFNPAYYKNFVTVVTVLNDWANKDYLKEVRINFNSAYYNNFVIVATALDNWASTALTKWILVNFNAGYYANYVIVATALDAWASQGLTKSIIVSFNSIQYALFVATAASITAWASIDLTKSITVAADMSSVILSAAAIALWISAEANKTITVYVDGQYYNSAVIAINTWLAKETVKTIGVTVDLTSYAASVVAIALWLVASATKTIVVKIDAQYFNKDVKILNDWLDAVEYKLFVVGFKNSDWENFWKLADMIDEWAGESLTKTIDVVINETTGTGGTKNNGSKNTTTTTSEKGLGWSLDKGLTWDGENVLDLGVKAIKNLFGFANGGYGIPTGDLFIANEAGAELVGSINGKTSVANQQQIVDGIASGVERANSEQNALLRQQNELLRGILEKDSSVRLNASAALGRTVQQSLNMYGSTGG